MEDQRIHDSDVNEFSVDERIATYLGKQSQKLSRRGLLAGAGRLILRLSGLALLPLLPFDRRANAYTDRAAGNNAACAVRFVKRAAEAASQHLGQVVQAA